MSQMMNPFEAPQAHPDPRATHPQGAGSFEIGQSVSDAWKACWANFPLWLGVGIVALIVAFVSTVTILGIFLILPVLTYGLTVFSLNMIDGDATFNDLFSGFSKYGHALGSMLLLFILTIVLELVGSSVQLVGEGMEWTVVGSIGQLLSLAWTCVVMARFMFAPYYIVDQEMGAIDAMKASWAATDQQKLNIVVLLLVGGVIAIAGVLALIIGIFPALVIAYLMRASAYRQLTGSYQS